MQDAALEDRVYNATIALNDNREAVVGLDLETSFAVLENAWRNLERSLIEANAAFNDAPTTMESAHNRAKRLIWAADDLKQTAAFIYQLTPLPDSLVEDE